MKRIYVIAALLLLLGVAGVGYSQDFGDWDSPTQEEPAPQNPVQKQYADGKVIAVIHAPRHYGYHIGDPVSLELVIVVAEGVTINTDAIVKGILSPTGSDFELVSAPVVTQWQQEGRFITSVKLTVRTWVTVDQSGKPKNNIPFNATFLYALDTLPDGKPNWVPAVSPDFIVTTSNTATDSSKDLIMGDIEQKPYPKAKAVTPLRLAGGALLLIPLGWLMFVVYRRFNPPRTIPANERAWIALDRVLSESNDGGITYERTLQVAHTLRAYLQVDSVPLAEVEAALETFFAKDSKQYELARVAQEALAILDRVLYERPEDETKIALSPRDTRELFARIERVVPRP
jgi:hypothetical protein